MSDPFGDDDTDFNVDAFQNVAITTAIELLVDDRSIMSAQLPSQVPNALSRKARGAGGGSRPSSPELGPEAELLPSEGRRSPPHAGGVGQQRGGSAGLRPPSRPPPATLSSASASMQRHAPRDTATSQGPSPTRQHRPMAGWGPGILSGRSQGTTGKGYGY